MDISYKIIKIEKQNLFKFKDVIRKIYLEISYFDTASGYSGAITCEIELDNVKPNQENFIEFSTLSNTDLIELAKQSMKEDFLVTLQQDFETKKKEFGNINIKYFETIEKNKKQKASGKPTSILDQ